MGYFSNGSEGHDYTARYCERCVHFKGMPEVGCAVWDAHLWHNYKANSNDLAMEILNDLIPRSKGGLDNEQCKMFVPEGG